VIGHARQYVGEPGTRIDLVQLGGDEQGRNRRGSLAAAVRAREQPSLPAEGYATQRSLCGVVGQADPIFLMQISVFTANRLSV
jgi:hypothetical protein